MRASAEIILISPCQRHYNHCKSLERCANAKDSFVNSTRQMRALALKEDCVSLPTDAYSMTMLRLVRTPTEDK